MKATIPGGELTPINNCFVFIPGFGEKSMQALPDISDSKGAAYSDEAIIGRSQPLKTYSHSENRVISMKIHLFTLKESDIDSNIKFLRALESAVYPREGTGGAPFMPPPVCKIKCGRILSDGELCVILKNYNVSFPTDVAWDENSMLPYKFSIDLSWEVVYSSQNLPGQERILGSGS